MKNNILTILAIAALFLLSFDKATSLLTQRSKQQVVLHGNNMNVLTNQINQMYLQGYRVTAIVGQPVASSQFYYYADRGYNNTHDISGEILVIMEK
jgi:hypothetical protein